MPDEGRWSIGISGWEPFGHPIMDAPPVILYTIEGQPYNANTIPSRIQFQGKPKVSPGLDIAAGAGKHHIIRLSVFRTQAAGDLVAPTNLVLWGGTYSQGTYLSMNYRVQNLKLSYEFLTWPYPIESRKFRLKTLWQFQYTSASSAFDAPLLPAANGPYNASGKKSIYLPALGLGVAYYLSPNFRVEANGTGFAIPGHSNLLDADASASYRVGRVEARVGFKAFHFRTSLNSDYYMRGNLVGAFVGLRYFLN